MRRVRTAAKWLFGLLLLWCVVLGVQIVAASARSGDRSADTAIVLGAAIRGKQPSPVFAERIRHGIALYRSGAVRTLLFTCGYGDGLRSAESEVARAYAMRRGVPAGAILIERRSQTTWQNLVQARRVMRARGLKTALIVSDPLHMKRAMRMADGLGMDASSSPTPTSRYRSWRSKSGFLLREIYFNTVYLLTGE
jgi:uncharacterized SAM-binding protein YcdF (DUF218 family)